MPEAGSSNCRHRASPAWLAREYEGRSAHEWACSPHPGTRSPMGGIAVPSPADKMQPVQRSGAAPWLTRPWLVPFVPHVWWSRAARAPRCGRPACYGLRHRCNGKAASQVTWGGNKSPGGGRMSASSVGDRQQQYAPQAVLVRGASGLARDLASVVIARGVSMADSFVSTILLRCHVMSRPWLMGPKCRYEVAEHLSTARSRSSSVHREEVGWTLSGRSLVEGALSSRSTF
jgi:hypothetical protein